MTQVRLAWLFRLLQRHPAAKRRADAVVRGQLATEAGLRQLNRLYARFGRAERRLWHRLFAKIYRDDPDPRIAEGVWKTTVAGSTVLLPIRRAEAWLDWDLACSIVGHDLDVKDLYFDLHRDGGIETFFDVGANYGTHSLLWRAMGARVHAFEPNPACRAKLDALMELNQLSIDTHGVAVGDEAVRATLKFPETETWLGSLDPDALDLVASPGRTFTSVDVEVIRLDDFVASTGARPDLVKLDTEGFELPAIRGARELLSTTAPVVVFESNRAEDRGAIFEELRELGYEVRRLHGERAAYGREAFVEERGNNFWACPRSRR